MGFKMTNSDYIKDVFMNAIYEKNKNENPLLSTYRKDFLNGVLNKNHEEKYKYVSDIYSNIYNNIESSVNAKYDNVYKFNLLKNRFFASNKVQNKEIERFVGRQLYPDAINISENQEAIINIKNMTKDIQDALHNKKGLFNSNEILDDKYSVVRQFLEQHDPYMTREIEGIVENKKRKGMNAFSKAANDFINSPEYLIAQDDYLKGRMSSVAAINYDGINEIVNAFTKDHTIVTSENPMSYKKNSGNLNGVIEEANKETNRNRNVNFFDLVTKGQKAEDFMNSVVNLNAQFTSEFVNINNVQKQIKDFNTAKAIASFDLEVIGGTNSDAIKTFDGITEFSMRLTDKAGKDISEFNTLVGLDDKKYEKLVNRANELFSTGLTQNENDNLFLSYYYKLGHGETNVIDHKNGLFTIGNYTDAEFSNSNYDIETVKKGLLKANEMFKAQTNTKVSFNGKEVNAYEDLVLRAIKSVQDNGAIVGGHNLANSDIPWLNKEVINKFSPNAQSAFYGLIGSNEWKPNYLDTMDLARTVNSFAGVQGVYGPEGSDFINNLNSSLKLTGNSLFTQETMGQAFFGTDVYKSNKLVAHVAHSDTKISNMFYTQDLGDGSTVISRLMGQISNHKDTGINYTDLRNRLEKGNDLIVRANRPMGNTGFNFNVNPLNPDEYLMFNGVGFNKKTGEAYNEINQWGIKKDGYYKLNSAGNRVDLTKNAEARAFVEQMYPDYNHNALYVSELEEISNVAKKDGKDVITSGRKTYLVAKSQEEFAQQMSNFLPSATFDGSNITEIAGTEELNKLYRGVVENGEIKYVDSGLSIQDKINDRMSRRSKDSAARKIREDNFNYYEKYNKFLYELEEKGIDTSSFDNIQQAFEDSIKIASEIKQNVSRSAVDDKTKYLEEVNKLVSKGVIEAKGGAIPLPDLNVIYGYEMNKKFNMAKYESIQNAKSNLKYIDSVMPIVNPILQEINSKVPGTEADKYNYHEQMSAFEYLFNSTKGDIVREITDNASPEQLLDIMNNYEMPLMTKADIDSFHVDLGESFFNGARGKYYGKEMAETFDDTFAINLKDTGYGLINKLLQNEYGEHVSSITGAGKEKNSQKLLNRLANKLAEDPSLSPYMNETLSAMKKGNNSSIYVANQIIENLKSARKDNEFIGFNIKKIQNTLGEAEISKLVGDGSHQVSLDRVNEIVRNNISNMPKFKSINTSDKYVAKNIESHVNSITSILMNGIDESRIDKIITDYGYNADQAEAIKMLYGTSKSEMKTYVSDLVTSSLQGGLGLTYNENTKEVLLRSQGEAVKIHNLLQLNEHNGALYMSLGNNKMMLYNTLSAKVTENGASLGLKTNIGKALDNVYNVKALMVEAVKQGKPLNQELGYLSNVREQMAQTIGFQYVDDSVRAGNLKIDMADAINVLPYAYKNDNIFSEDVDKKFRFGSEIKKLLEGRTDFNNIYGGDKETLAIDFKRIIDMLAGRYGDNNVKKIVSMAEGITKDTDAERQVYNVGGLTHNALHQFTNQARPVYNQNYYKQIRTDLTAKREKKFDKLLGYDSKKTISENFLLENKNTLATRNALKNNGIRQSVVANVLSTDDLSFKALMVDKLKNKGSNGKIKIGNTIEINSDLVKDIILDNNLQGDQGIADSRMADAIFYHQDLQKISAKKKIDKELTISSKINEKMTKVSYKVDVDPNTGRVTINYAKESVVGKRGDPFLHTVGFGGSTKSYGIKDNYALVNRGFFKADGTMVSQQELDKTIKEFNSKGMFKDIVGHNANNESVSNSIVERVAKLNNWEDAYFAKDLFEESYTKFLYEDSEKSMFNKLYLGLGQSDTIKKALAPHLDKEIQKGSNVYIRDLRGEVLSDKAIKLIEQATGDKNLSHLIFKEKHALSKLIFSDILDDQVSLVSSTNDIKHKNINTEIASLTRQVFERLDDSKKETAARNIFKFDNTSFKDGSIMLDSKIDTNIDNYIDTEALRNMAKEVGLFNESSGTYGKVIEHDGAVIGGIKTLKTGNANLISRGSGSAGAAIDLQERIQNNLQAIAYKRSEIDRKIKEVGPNFEGKRGIQKHIAKLEHQNKELQVRYNIASKLEKGASIGGRETMALSSRTMEEAYNVMRPLVGNGLDENQFMKLMKGAVTKDDDGKLVFDRTRRNELVNSNIVSNIYDEMLFKKGETVAPTQMVDGELKSYLAGNNAKYKDVHQALLDNKYNPSLEGVKKIYEYEQNIKADKLNVLSDKEMSNYSYNLVKDGKTQAELDGFKVLKLHELENAGDDTTKLFGNNLIVDMQRNGEDLGGNRFFAIGAHEVGKTGDNEILDQAQREISKLIKSNNRHEDRLADASKAREVLVDNRKIKEAESVQAIKQKVAQFVSGKKEGLEGLTKMRMPNAIISKASSQMVYTPKIIEKVLESKDVNEAQKAFLQRVLGDKGSNAAVLSKRSLNKNMFLDKTIQEWSNQGVHISTAEVGLGTLETMGYFSNKSMSSILGRNVNDSNAKAAKEEVLKTLQTKGDIVLSGRYPANYAESVNNVMLYYNPNITGNRHILNIGDQLAKHGDNDGDIGFLARLTGRTKEDIVNGVTQGESYAAHLNGHGKKELESYWLDAQQSILNQANGANKVFINDAIDDLVGQMHSSGTGKDITNFISEHPEGRVFAGMRNTMEMSKVLTYSNSHNILTKAATEQNVSIHQLVNNSSEEDIRKLLNVSESIITEHGSAKRFAGNTLAIMPKIVEFENEHLAKWRKSAIGSADLTAYKMKNYYEHAFRYLGDGTQLVSGKDNSLLKNILVNTQNEITQKVISSKHDDLINVTRAQDLHTAMNHFMKNDSKNLETWLNTNINEKTRKRILGLAVAQSGVEARNIGEKDIVPMFIEGMNNLRNSENGGRVLQNFHKALGIGNSMTAKVGQSRDMNGFLTNEVMNSVDFLAKVHKDLQNEAEHLSNNMTKVAKPFSTKDYIMTDGKGMVDDGQTLRKVVQSIGEKFSKVEGKNLALGMLGVAGAVMFAGAVSGNPATAPGTEAADLNNNSDFYSVPNLTDQQNIGQRNQGGYIINVDANSHKGTEQVKQIINQAVQQSIPTDVRVSMNINNIGGNINDRTIERIISGAF